MSPFTYNFPASYTTGGTTGSLVSTTYYPVYAKLSGIQTSPSPSSANGGYDHHSASIVNHYDARLSLLIKLLLMLLLSLRFTFDAAALAASVASTGVELSMDPNDNTPSTRIPTGTWELLLQHYMVTCSLPCPATNYRATHRANL